MFETFSTCGPSDAAQLLLKRISYKRRYYLQCFWLHFSLSWKETAFIMDYILCHHRLESCGVTKKGEFMLLHYVNWRKRLQKNVTVLMANVWYPWETGEEREHFHTFVYANVIDTEAKKYCHRERKNRLFYDFLWPIKHCQQALTLAKHRYYKRPVNH